MKSMRIFSKPIFKRLNKSADFRSYSVLNYCEINVIMNHIISDQPSKCVGRFNVLILGHEVCNNVAHTAKLPMSSSVDVDAILDLTQFWGRRSNGKIRYLMIKSFI